MRKLGCRVPGELQEVLTKLSVLPLFVDEPDLGLVMVEPPVGSTCRDEAVFVEVHVGDG